MSEKPLKPCPFCGVALRVFTDDDAPGIDAEHPVVAGCFLSGYEMPNLDPTEWNNRADPLLAGVPEGYSFEIRHLPLTWPAAGFPASYAILWDTDGRVAADGKGPTPEAAIADAVGRVKP